MAITILSTPQAYSPVYNPIEFGLSSTNVGQANFKYICDIYTSGVTGYTRHKTDPNPDNNYGIFDVHRILESYLTHDIDKGVYAQALNANSYVAFELKFGEEYGPSSGIIVYPNLSFSGIYYAFNGVLDWDKFVLYQDEKHFAATDNYNVLNRYYQNIPVENRDNSQQYETLKIRYGDDAWLHYMTSGVVDRYNVIAYNSTGGVIKNSTFKGNDVAADTNYLHRFVRIPAGVNNLNLITSGDITTGTQPLIPTNTHYYTITLKRNSPAGTFSNPYVYYVDDCDTTNPVIEKVGTWEQGTQVCNGTCSTNVNTGTVQTGTTIAQAHDTIGDSTIIKNDYLLIPGRYYKVTYTATFTVGQEHIKWKIESDDAAASYYQANGTYIEYVLADYRGTLSFKFMGTSTGNTGEVTISNIRIQEMRNYNRIHFLNKLGAFESMNFKGLNKRNESIEKNNYKKVTGKWSGTTFTRDSFDRQNITYNTKIKDSYSCNTGWINEQERNFIEEMITSPACYLDDGVRIWGINIINTGFEWKEVLENKLFNYVIEFERFDRYRQRY